jgi:hypothetical protein
MLDHGKMIKCLDMELTHMEVLRTVYFKSLFIFMFIIDGTEFEGEFLNGKKHGAGVIRLPNGDRSEGNWSNGKEVGESKYFKAGS